MSEDNEVENLKDFIDEYHHVITVMGVFAALTGFFLRLENGEWLAFVSLVGFILFDWELYSATVRLQKISRRLYIFQIVLISLAGYVFLYIITTYGYQFVVFLPPLLLFIYGGAVLKICSTFSDRIRKALAVISALIIAFFLAAFLVNLIYML